MNYSASEIQEMSIAQLASVYNEIQRSTGGKEISKFSDKASAVRRTLAALASMNSTNTSGELDLQPAVEDEAVEVVDQVVETEVETELEAAQEAEAAVEAAAEAVVEPVAKTKRKPKAKAKAEAGEKEGEASFSMLVDGGKLKYYLSETTLVCTQPSDKPDSIRGAFQQAVENAMGGSLVEIAEEFIQAIPFAPSSGKKVDTSFVIRRMKRLIRKGYFELSKLK